MPDSPKYQKQDARQLAPEREHATETTVAARVSHRTKAALKQLADQRGTDISKLVARLIREELARAGEVEAAAEEGTEWQEAEAARAQAEAEAQQQQEAKHTPGPWRAFKSTDGYSVDDYIGGIQPAPKVEGNGEDESRANAALIGAAPDLLEAAKQALHVIQEHEDGLRPSDAKETANALQAAIGNATYTEEL